MPHHLIRRLNRYDRTAISDHFLRLDPHTLRLRFGYSVSDDHVRAYIKDVQKLKDPTFGVVVEGEIRALAQMLPLTGLWPREYEVAFSVEKDWQDRGFGNALMNRVLAVAQNRGVRTLHLICLRENKRMQRLVAKHNGALTYDDGDVEAKVQTPWPTLRSMTEETMGETWAYFDAVLRMRPPYAPLRASPGWTA